MNSGFICGISALSTFVFLFAFPVVECERILFLVPISTHSETNMYRPLANALAARGHHITVVTPIKSDKTPERVKEIVIVPASEILDPMGVNNPFENNFLDDPLYFVDFDYINSFAHRIFQSPEFQSEVVNQKFDVVFLNPFFNEAYYGLVHKFQAACILLNTFPIPNYLIRGLGSYVPTSFVPYPSGPYSAQIGGMSFKERISNFLIDWYLTGLEEFSYRPKFEAVYRKYLGQDTPSVSEIHKNTSLVLVNSHVVLTHARPLLPDIIEVGGLHCRPGEKLPKEFEDFISGAEHGVILFTLGSVARTDSMPESTMKAFLNVFSRLKQRVIWKFESGKMANQPKNVMLSKWLPQQDILAHPKTKLFITHSGLLSSHEYTYHGVPALALPLFFEQMTNAKISVSNGYALELDIRNITEENLETSIRRLLDEPKLRERAKQIQSVIRDVMETPLERAVFWTEYVMRHKGAPHLRSAARDLNFIQYHSLDVLACLLIIATTILFIFCKICKFIIKLIFGQSSISVNRKQKRNKFVMDSGTTL